MNTIEMLLKKYKKKDLKIVIIFNNKIIKTNIIKAKQYFNLQYNNYYEIYDLPYNKLESLEIEVDKDCNEYILY